VEESFLFTRIRRGTLLRLALGPDHRLLRPPVRGKQLLLGPGLLSTTLLLREGTLPTAIDGGPWRYLTRLRRH